MEAFSDAAHDRYRSLVEHPDLIPYYLTLDPGRRARGDEHRLPTVAPSGWRWRSERLAGHSLGVWLDPIPPDHPRLVRGRHRSRRGRRPSMAKPWPTWPSDFLYLQTFLANVEMTLAKTDLSIAERYVAAWSPPSTTISSIVIKEEYELTVTEVTKLTGREILGSNPLLARTLEVRNIYLDPINYLQISLLGAEAASKDPN